jgi:DNA-binding PadR family transcriptional regulator
MTTSQIPEYLRSLFPLTPAVFFILFALTDGQKHGYAIMQDVRSLSDEKVRVGPGTLYSTIQRLLEFDLIAETEGIGEKSDHEKRRRYYKLTRMGRTVLDEEISRMDSVVRLARRKRLLPGTAK